MKIKETDVILNFLEDSTTKFRRDSNVEIEFPAGSWSGNKSRSIADIHGHGIPGIEAKSNFKDSKKDFQNPEKNQNIKHYIYSSNEIKNDEINFWKKNGVSVAIFLTNENKWFTLDDENGFFSSVLRSETIAKEIV